MCFDLISRAIPLHNIKAKNIVKALIMFFTMVGLPQTIQSDQGMNFMSGLFQQVMYQLCTKLVSKSSAYYPEPQGALEQFHHADTQKYVTNVLRG